MFKAHRLCVSLNSRLESNKEEERRPSELGVELVDLFEGVLSEDVPAPLRLEEHRLDPESAPR